MECECITALITLLGFLVAFVSIYVAFKQYKEDRRFKNTSYFMELRNRFKENQYFTIIREKVEAHEDLGDLSRVKIYDYVGFFEDLQIAINSGYVEAEAVYYLFGYYVLTFSESKLSKFTPNDAPLWVIYNKLIKTMKDVESKKANYTNLKF